MILSEKITLTCVMGVDPDKFDLNLIYHFIKHYRNMGIEKILIAINADTEKKTKEGIQVLKECGITPVKIWINKFLEASKMIELHALQSMVETDWIFAVDSDELVRIDMLENVIQMCEDGGFVACRGQLIDRIAGDRKLLSVCKEQDIFEQFPIEEYILQLYNKNEKSLKERKFALDCKCFLFKSRGFKVGNGQHYLYYNKALDISSGINKLEDVHYYPEWFKIDHFKWTATCINRLKRRLEDFLADPNCNWIDEVQWVYDCIKNGSVVKNKGL